MAGAIVSASTGVISTLIPKLSRLIEGEYNLQNGVKSKINFLKDELSSMQTLLMKLSNNEERLDVQEKDWRNKVCIDLFMHKMSKDGTEANLVKKTISKIKNIWSRHKMANLIEELKTRVEEEGHRRKRYRFDEPASQVVQIDPQLPALFVEAERLVGIDGPREQVIELMKEDDYGKQLKVVSIVGFGGLGKTTLANQVYQKIKGQFDCSWSCIDPSDDERQLIDKLRAFLQDKRYFIIVDDIWSTQAWELVKSALPENNLNSRIITTTRIDIVAESCCSSLTGYRVFGDASACPPHFEEMSHGILKKCHGLPLATITIASLLAGKSNRDEWEQVYNSISSAFSHQGMRDILLLSYYDLPHHLKTCLLYLSMFREDYEIYTEELIWRWVAKGFITKVKDQSADQVTENYFNELVNRSLIQPIYIQYDGRACACRVHDMVLELIVSLSKDGNFSSIVEDQSYKVGGHTIRRLSVQSEHLGDEVIQEIMDKWSQVRSISFYGLQEQGIPHLQELYSLRVLKLPPSIGRLQKLVRLLVSNTVKLPDEVGDLQALQELTTIYQYSIKLVEALRHLTKLKKLGIDMLNRWQLGCDTEQYEEAFKSSLAAMGKHGLQSLRVTKYDILEEELMDILCCTVPCLRELVVDGPSITRLPKQIVSLVNLTYLRLCIERIKQEDLCILGAIPTLLSADLSAAHAPDERLTIRTMETESKMGFEFSFEQLASLEHNGVRILPNNVTRSGVEAAEAAIRNAVSIHPGQPTLDLKVEGTTIEDKDEGEDRSGHGMAEVLEEDP
uniref:NB-ARC domain-containing protein n=1 Tax=Setaria italica TaxID=4555 RepID=K3Z400_SETIT